MKKLKTYWPSILIFLILIVGAFFRLYRISEYMTFLGDEGRDVLIVKRMIIDHKFTLLGPTASVGGFFLGPVYYYFMLPFLWLWRLNPVGPAIMVAFFGIATIYLVYYLGAKFFDKTTGLIASALYAISPLVVGYSRSSWNPNLMPFFSILIMLTIYEAMIKKSLKRFLLVGFFLGITLQLHYLASFLIAIVAIYIFLVEKKFFIEITRHYLTILIGFIVGLSPFLAFEIRHGFPNFISLWRFIFVNQKEIGFVGGTVFDQFKSLLFRLFWRLLTRFPPLSDITLSKEPEINFWYWLVIVLIFTSLGTFFYKLFKAWQNKDKESLKKLIIIFCWLFLGLVFFSFYKKEIYDYYLGFIFFIPFLLIGLMISTMIKSKNLLFQLTAICLLVALLWVNFEGRPFRFTPNNQLGQVKNISQFLLEKTEGKPFNFALITGQNSDHGYRYFLEILGNSPMVIENEQNDPERKTVTSQLLVICEEINCQPLGHPLWEIAGFGQAEIVGQWDVSFVKLFKLIHYKKPLK